jgi:hypoxanthine-guanine phosphoribosyltransferase
MFMTTVSTALCTRLDILKSVSKDVKDYKLLVVEAIDDTKTNSSSITEEIKYTINAQIRAMNLAHKEFTAQTIKERERGVNSTTMYYHQLTADEYYLEGFSLIIKTVASAGELLSRQIPDSP